MYSAAENGKNHTKISLSNLLCYNLKIEFFPSTEKIIVAST